MLVFVDESGDAGLKIGQGSSDYFLVALVIFNDNEEAGAADNRILLLRRELRVDSRFEFKFAKCNRRFREAFLAAIAPYEFFYYAIIIDKDPEKLYGEGFRYKDSFYRYASSLVFQNAKAYLDNATVGLDGSGSRDFRKQLERYLKKRINEPGQHQIAKVKVQDSVGNNLLQLADMVAGTIHRSLGCKDDAQAYRKIISHREMHVQAWPK